MTSPLNPFMKAADHFNSVRGYYVAPKMAQEAAVLYTPPPWDATFQGYLDRVGKEPGTLKEKLDKALKEYMRYSKEKQKDEQASSGQTADR
jgi:hypothetical protein